MSSFFVSSDKIKVGQTDVSIPSENGLNYRPGGRIELYIPPTSKFIDRITQFDSLGEDL